MASSPTNLSRSFVFLVFIHFVLCHICNGDYHGETLYSGERLSRAENLVNGPYSLVFRDCRLQLLDASHEKENPVWESRTTTGDYTHCKCEMKDNGNLVVIGSNSWAAMEVEKEEEGDYVLVLRFDRDMAIYGPALWSSGTKGKRGRYDIENHAVKNLTYKERRNRGHVLYSDGEPLRTRDYLRWGSYILEMERDCNLVLYFLTQDDVKTIWSTNTAGAGTNCYLEVGAFGTLRVRDGNKKVKWSADTRLADEYDQYVFILNRDGEMVLYDKAIWQTLTYDPHHPKVTETTTATNGIAAVV